MSGRKTYKTKKKREHHIRSYRTTREYDSTVASFDLRDWLFQHLQKARMYLGRFLQWSDNDICAWKSACLNAVRINRTHGNKHTEDNFRFLNIGFSFFHPPEPSLNDTYCCLR